jgi:hypothetical protein
MHFPKPSVQSIVRYEHEQGVQKNQHAHHRESHLRGVHAWGVGKAAVVAIIAPQIAERSQSLGVR